ncbi:MAG: hypothetical protein ACM3JD_07750, partial [Rudaea sp.]
VLEKEAPGLVQAMIAAGLQKTPHAMLSRMAAGVRGRTLIVNLPGSPQAATENFLTILPALPHALELLKGGQARHDFDHPVDAEERERQERDVTD